ncbi:amidophosphoribosyltransferase [Paremcibacter congregatus]|uniref:Amidophosphoribosyltransferase n=1 Tax=Paremcibacter congregatus TaxID=2043170 RepID=A0A2G4YV08_9PROT|nr:amidophosphoribosyltransferase [Paremcibacter congregatus]PHZ86080.1 amidophosphoribosyltransferase [Paremcibacter congregatus]QDE27046.1 amidophosphoribosyltransferase [Paremcibacter congregatus]
MTDRNSSPLAPQAPLATSPFSSEGDDKFHDECGVFGIYKHPESAAHTVLGLHALQHRGQEAAGIVTFDKNQFHSHKSQGHVADNFNSQPIIESLPGDSAIGHVRYSTAGGGGMRNIQPLFADLASGGFAVAHNGNLTNAVTLRQLLVSKGSIFQSTSDSEVLIHLVATSTYQALQDRFIDALRRIEGAFAIVALSKKRLIGARDPLGVRPLVLGKLSDSSYIFASETCALDIIGAEYIRDVEPGEVITIDENGLHSLKPFPVQKPRPCIFEHVYFSRPDSLTDGTSVYKVRKHIGRELAKESKVKADLVVPVPDSGTPAAIGYAQEAGIPFELGIIRNHYVGRTFIEPSDQIRHLGVKLKHNANRGEIEGKIVVLVDDSIVRGTTSIKIVDMVRQAGAKEVHLRIASPPTTDPCYYGVDTPEKDKLLASRMSIEEMTKYIGADSLDFISIDGLYRAVCDADRNPDEPQYCDACFTGEYPTHLTDKNQHDAPEQISFLNESNSKSK